MAPSTRGFTLIELSIVLVIIGLIVGAITVGRDLIKAAEIRSTIKQPEELNAAVNTFLLKYNCLPGDCPNATTFGFTDINGTTNASANGSGDGQISNYYFAPDGVTVVPESVNTYVHLFQSKLYNAVVDTDNSIGRVYTKLGTPDYQGNVGQWTIAYNNGKVLDVVIGTRHNLTTKAGNYFMLWSYSMSYPGAVTPIDAFAIDSKTDDGLPNTGKTLATSQIGAIGLDHGFVFGGGGTDYIPTFDSGTDTGAAGAGSNFCVTNAPYVYNVANTSQAQGSLCTMIVKASF